MSIYNADLPAALALTHRALCNWGMSCQWLHPSGCAPDISCYNFAIPMQARQKVIRFLLLILVMIAGACAASPLELWRGRNPLPTGENLRRAASANGLTLLGGGSSATNLLLVLTNGTDWTIGATTGTRGINELIYANGLWVAAAGSSSPDRGGGIATSADGTNWTVRLDSPARRYVGVAQGNMRFVAVSPSGLAISTNGIDWSEPFIPNTSANAITFAFGKFFIGTDTDIRFSTDGLIWTVATNTFSAGVRAFAFGGGRLVGLGSASSAWGTADGSTWTRTLFNATGNWISAAYGNGMFVGLVDNSTLIWTSTDGSNWVQRIVGDYSHLGVSFADGQFILAGTFGHIFTSPDGTNWTARSSNEGISGVKRIAYLNGAYVAVGDVGMIMTSSDGTTWKQRPLFSTVFLRTVAYGNGVYLAGASGNMVVSTNGTNWAEMADGCCVLALAFGNGLFVGLSDGSGGSTAQIRTSVDGTTWSPRTNLTSGPLSDVVFANGLFVAVGTGPRIFTSTDGIQWTRQTVSFTDSLTALTYGNGRFYATASFSKLAYSDDGTNWSIVPGPPGVFPAGIAAGDGCVALLDSSRPRIWFSYDLRSWSNVQLRSSGLEFAIAHGPGRFLIGGSGGQIWESAPVISLRVGTPGTIFVSGPPNLPCEIQRNTDLNTTNWIPFGTVTLSNAPVLWFDPQLNLPERAFYRGLAPTD
ncbi:MAG TPA: hypothetical protein VMZ27_12190 [Candidatus Saccharimonadales bacterium]|nr:hypothetical protein [Candidatus Saccharimonadales bacterium]